MLEDSIQKPITTKSRMSPKPVVKKKYSEFHFNVGLGKRIDPLGDENRGRSQSAPRWESLNLKKDHLKKFAGKNLKSRHV